MRNALPYIINMEIHPPTDGWSGSKLRFNHATADIWNDDSGTTHYAYGAVHMKSPILVIYIPRPLDSTGDVENLNTFRHPSRKPVHRFPCLRGIITPLWPLIAPSSSGRACNGTCVGFLRWSKVETMRLLILTLMANSKMEGDFWGGEGLAWNIDQEGKDRWIEVIVWEVPFVGHPNTVFLRCLKLVPQKKRSVKKIVIRWTTRGPFQFSSKISVPSCKARQCRSDQLH